MVNISWAMRIVMSKWAIRWGLSNVPSNLCMSVGLLRLIFHRCWSGAFDTVWFWSVRSSCDSIRWCVAVAVACKKKPRQGTFFSVGHMCPCCYSFEVHSVRWSTCDFGLCGRPVASPDTLMIWLQLQGLQLYNDLLLGAWKGWDDCSFQRSVKQMFGSLSQWPTFKFSGMTNV